jgi:putative sigma-54 modulation protein
MSINFTARRTKVTPEIKKYCAKRLKALEKMLGYSLEADLLLSVEKYRNKVEINVKTKKSTINTIEETHDMFSSLVIAFDHIEKRIKKEREKLRERRRNREIETFTLPEEAEERQKRVVRSQSYSLKPMSLEEAVVQLEATRDEVFVFRMIDSEKWAILFRRKDGNYGLIEPE